MSYVLIVMFVSGVNLGSTSFVAMQKFDSEEACKKAQVFVMSNHAFSRSECIKDDKPKT